MPFPPSGLEPPPLLITDFESSVPSNPTTAVKECKLFNHLNNLQLILGQDNCLSGLNEEKEKILRLFGQEVCRVYKLV